MSWLFIRLLKEEVNKKDKRMEDNTVALNMSLVKSVYKSEKRRGA